MANIVYNKKRFNQAQFGMIKLINIILYKILIYTSKFQLWYLFCMSFKYMTSSFSLLTWGPKVSYVTTSDMPFVLWPKMITYMACERLLRKKALSSTFSKFLDKWPIFKTLFSSLNILCLIYFLVIYLLASFSLFLHCITFFLLLD